MCINCCLFLHLSATSEVRGMGRTSAFSFVITQRAGFGHEKSLRNWDAFAKVNLVEISPCLVPAS